MNKKGVSHRETPVFMGFNPCGEDGIRTHDLLTASQAL